MGILIKQSPFMQQTRIKTLAAATPPFLRGVGGLSDTGLCEINLEDDIVKVSVTATK